MIQPDSDTERQNKYLDHSQQLASKSGLRHSIFQFHYRVTGEY